MSSRTRRDQGPSPSLIEGVALLVLMLGAGAASVFVLSQDANWDLRNYHFYNPWAFVHDRLGWDLAPAQLQTFHNPLLDLPFYWMVAADWPPRLIAFVMALPAGIGAFFLGKVLLLLFADLPGRQRWGYSALAFAVGITASGPVSLLGSTMNDWPGAALIMIALWLLLRRGEREDARWGALVAAGVVAGIAAGLKLTTASYAIGLCAALFAQPPILGRGLRDSAVFGVCVIAGVLLSCGAWMWTLYTHFESPLFPYFNDVFRSPWWDAARIVDARFGPHSLLGWLTFPLPLFTFAADYVTEAPFRDWRLPLVYLALIGVLISWLLRRLAKRGAPRTESAAWGKWRLLLIFWGVSFLVWARMYAIYRYIMPLELLSGVLLIYLLRSSLPRRWLPAVAMVAAALAIVTVRYPAWGRVAYGEHYFAVAVPPVAPHSAILLLSVQPMSFVLPFFPPDARFLGAENNLNDPGRQNRLEEEIARIVREHAGPLYSLTTPAGYGGEVLDAHGLRRVSGDCGSIVSNVSPVPFELCRLERSGAAAQTTR
jgi:hypothetical protein